MGCGEVVPPSELVRVVAQSLPVDRSPTSAPTGELSARKRGSVPPLAKDKESALVVDDRRRLPGRGAWLHLKSSCLEKARVTGRLTRSLRRSRDTDWSNVERYFATVGVGE